MAAGRVCTGFSSPLVAVYNNGTYSDGTELARGVNVEVSVTKSDDNIFYADNAAAETVGGAFASGTLTLTVDGLKAATRRLLYSTLPSSEGISSYPAAMTGKSVGVGFIARFMENGATSYVGFVVPNVVFDLPSLSAATQEEDINWQTEQLTGTILKDANGNWLYETVGSQTEATTLAAIKTLLNIAATT